METISRHREPVCSYDNFLRTIDYEDLVDRFNYFHKKYAPKPKRVFELKYDIKIKKYHKEFTHTEATYNTLTKPIIKKIKLLNLVNMCECMNQ
jgi:hypothetical protein